MLNDSNIWVSNNIEELVIIVLILFIIATFRTKWYLSRAKKIINNISNGRNVFDNLTTKLKNGTYYEKLLSIEAMANTGKTQFVIPLTDNLMINNFRTVKNVAVKTKILKSLHVYNSPAIISPLIEYIESNNSALRKAARFSIEKLRYDFIIPHFKTFIHNSHNIDALISIIKACGQISSQDSEELFIELLQDESNDIRRYASKYTYAFKSNLFISTILNQYERENNEIRKNLLNSLATIKSINSLKALIHIRNHHDRTNNKIISMIKETIASNNATDEIMTIIKAIISSYRENRDGQILSIALDFIISHPNETIKTIIINDMSLYDNNNLLKAIIVLKHYKDYETTNVLISYLDNSSFKDDGTNVLIPYLDNDSFKIVIQVLNSLEGRKGQNLFLPLLNKSQCKHPKIAAKSVNLLGNLQDKRAIDPLIRLLNNCNKFVKIEILKALTIIGGKYDLGPIYPLLKSENNELRIKAAQMIGEVKNVNSCSMLISFINDKNDQFRFEIINSLVKINKPDVLLKILVTKLKDKNDKIKELAILYLVKHDYTKAHRKIKKLMKLDNQKVSELAIWGASLLEKKKKYKYLLPYLNSKNENIVIQCLRALAHIKNYDTIDLIKPHLKNWNTIIRIEAVRAIGEFAPHPKAEKILLEALDDWSVDFKCAIIESLVNFKNSEKVINSIIEYNMHEDDYVKTTSHKVLEIMKGNTTTNNTVAPIIKDDEQKTKAEIIDSDNNENIDVLEIIEDGNTSNQKYFLKQIDVISGEPDENTQKIQILVIEDKIMKAVENFRVKLEYKLTSGSNEKKGKNYSFYSLIKNAENHPQLTTVLNFSALHEVRYYRNKIAHRHSDEYQINNFSTLERYLYIMEQETKKLLEVT